MAAMASAAKPAPETAAKVVPSSSSRPFASKPVQHRERGIGQPFRAHPAAPSSSAESATNSASQDRSASGAATATVNSPGGSSAAGGGVGGTSGAGEGHRPFTPRSLALASDASARLVVSRAPPQPQQSGSARSNAGFSSAWGSRGAVAADGSSPQANGGDGDDKSKDHHSFSRQLPRSANTSTASSPRANRAGSPPGWGHDGDATLGYSGSISNNSSSGVVAPPHGGRTDVGEGGGGAGGRRFSQGVMRPPKIHNGIDGTVSSPPAQARGLLDGGGAATEAAGEGVILPGPGGGVEVREFDGGVLVVRRSEEEKKKSPERLNLHRRRLKSCPVVQVSGSLFGLNASLFRLSTA